MDSEQLLNDILLAEEKNSLLGQRIATLEAENANLTKNYVMAQAENRLLQAEVAELKKALKLFQPKDHAPILHHQIYAAAMKEAQS
jgi:hypothetical protein